MSGFKAGRYGSFEKVYVQGMIKATLSWYITGEKGYVLRVNKTEFKKHFETVDAAERVADEYVMKAFKESEFFKSLI